MNHSISNAIFSFGSGNTTQARKSILMLIVCSFIFAPQFCNADESSWEYKVVILQGVTAGGSIEKDSTGVYVDTLRTSALNALAADGWEVVAVMGAVATDHAVYLRRKSGK